ncbi:MAG TPA: 1-acyl-sn-glycerol-3-phosphate acyltransferase [Vicinamibacterales bacterium]|nr:1-acyl-sn-glycerol-3-phosphate acyltransferase [Vicinamibacterales bacterium]
MSGRANPLVRSLAKAVCLLFYRIEVVGHVPEDGAVLLLPNHPNALLDPALVWATAGRDVRFLAKSTLFDGPLRPVLAGARAIPVYRRIDKGADTSRNVETFAEVSAALAQGDAVCLFPEGISHSTGRLEPLRTGAARMALDAERAGHAVTLVAVGLNFDRKTTFRSRVAIVYGQPFSGRDLLPAPDADLQDSVRALTDRIAGHMRRLLVEADPAADAALVDRVDRLYAAARGRARDPVDRLARRRTIAAGMERLRSVAPDRYDELLLRLRRYDERLRRFGIRDRHLDWQVGTQDAAVFAARELAIGLVLVPLCLAGLLAFFVPYRLTGFAARFATRERDVYATAQVISGAIIYGTWLGAVALAAWWFGGRTHALLAVIVLPLLAVASLFAIERESAVVDAVRSWLLLRRARHETRERLRRRRSELADVLDEVHAWLSANNVRGS